jgi:uncharacterized protein Veg
MRSSPVLFQYSGVPKAPGRICAGAEQGRKKAKQANKKIFAVFNAVFMIAPIK